MMLEICPASRSFEEPDFMNMSYRSVVSKSYYQMLAKARGTLSITVSI